jgi:hypothetical protein
MLRDVSEETVRVVAEMVEVLPGTEFRGVDL